MTMKDKAVGFYITIIAAVLSAIGLILYPKVMYKLPIVYIFCTLAVVITVIAVVLSAMGKKITVLKFLPVVNSVLMASAAVWAVNLMVNQIGYVIAELDEKSTIMGLIYFEVAAVLSMLLNIISSFMNQEKDN